MEIRYFDQIESEEPPGSFKELFVFMLVFFSLIGYFECKPKIDKWRCKRITAELRKEYGLVVKYTNPSEFYIPPLFPLTNDPEIGFSIEAPEPDMVINALIGLRRALAKYPNPLLRKYLEAVFIAGKLKVFDTEIGGTYAYRWIYISVDPSPYIDSSPQWCEKVLHHELSSLFMHSTLFPTYKWEAVNKSDFSYFSDPIEVARYIRRNPTKAPEWHSAGFVDDYGMTSLENDLNTYAELAMTDPEKLKQLADQYPRIRAKTQILSEFYSRLAPELKRRFAK
jgi:hypothetical protein